MAINCAYFKHHNLTGDSSSFALDNSWRYWRIKFGSVLRNEITSFRASAHSGFAGNVYGFANNDYTGAFAALNMAEGWTCWWNNVGPLNDTIESAIQVNRNLNEFTLELGGMIRDRFKDQLDAQLAGQQVSRSGDPIISAMLWPSFDPTRKFLRIHQPLHVALDWWPDYAASITYDIYFYLASPTEVRAYVAWVHTWVEGGIFSGDISDELHPQALAGAAQVDAALASQLPLLTLVAAFRGRFDRLYLLPGLVPEMPPPNTNFGRLGESSEGCTLVLTFG